MMAHKHGYRLSMIRSLTIAGMAFLVAGPNALAQDAKPTVKVVGVRVAAEIPGDEMQSLSVFNGQTGTALAVLVHSETGGLIAFDDENSKADVFADDGGTNLLEGGGAFGVFSPFTRISDDTKMALIEMRADGLPAGGAKAIKARGVFKFTHATKTAKAKADSVALKSETTFEVGPFKFAIGEVGDEEWGDAVMQVELTSKQNTDPIRGVRFLDAEGNEIESEQNSSGYMGFGNDITYSIAFGLNKKAETASIEIEYWEDLKTMDLPFEVTTGVGLGK